MASTSSRKTSSSRTRAARGASTPAGDDLAQAVIEPVAAAPEAPAPVEADAAPAAAPARKRSPRRKAADAAAEAPAAPGDAVAVAEAMVPAEPVAPAPAETVAEAAPAPAAARKAPARARKTAAKTASATKTAAKAAQPAKATRKATPAKARAKAAPAEAPVAVAAPVVEPAVEPVIEAAVEPVVEPVVERITEPVPEVAVAPSAETAPAEARPKKRAPRRKPAAQAVSETAGEAQAQAEAPTVAEPAAPTADEPAPEIADTAAVVVEAEAQGEPACGQAVDNTTGTPEAAEADAEQAAAAEPAPAEIAEPEVAAPAEPPAPPFSQVTLEDGLRRRLAWTAGRDCPAELLALATQLDEPSAAAPLVNDLALLEMARVARERRHALRIDEAVWQWLAPARDMRERVRLLESRLPEGPASPLLAALVALPLRPYQGEGALYAACAGRSVLADDTGLGRTVQAVAALRLMAAQFGAERALVLTPAERRAHWAAQWLALTGLEARIVASADEIAAATLAPASPQAPLLLLADVALVGDAAALAMLQTLGADTLVVDESDDADASPWLDTAFTDALATLESAFALVIARAPVEARPRALRAMLAWIDTPRLGALERLDRLEQQADAPAPDRLEALAPWLLRRTKTLVLRQLPETVEAICPVELDAAERPLHDARRLQLVRAVQRWQRSRYLSDADQRRLLATLHALRLGCNAGKIATAVEGIETLLAAPDMRVVVFSQWAGSLALLSDALEARGIAHLALPVDVAGEARRALIGAFQQDPQQRVLLCCDDSPGGQLGLRHAATAILHLDRPWNPAMLAQRFSRIHRADRVRQVPVCHLVASGTLEERLMQAQDDAASRELFVGLVDGAQAEVFLGGARLERFMAALEVLTGVMPADTAASVAPKAEAAPEPAAAA